MSVRRGPGGVTYCQVLSFGRAGWWLIPPSYALWLRTLFSGWPVVVHGMHMRRCTLPHGHLGSGLLDRSTAINFVIAVAW